MTPYLTRELELTAAAFLAGLFGIGALLWFVLALLEAPAARRIWAVVRILPAVRYRAFYLRHPRLRRVLPAWRVYVR